MAPHRRLGSGVVVHQPQIAEITGSEIETLVHFRCTGAARFDGIESHDDLRNNWNRLPDAAGLTAEERKLVVSLFNRRVDHVLGADG